MAQITLIVQTVIHGYTATLTICFILKGYYTEKIKASNMIGIKLVKHCNIFFQHLPA